MCEQTVLAGSYVLGSLAPRERLAFEQHLASCDECSRTVRELAALPPLLAHVGPEVLDHDAPQESVPSTLLPALVAATRRDRLRQRWLGIAAGVAAALVLAVPVAVLVGTGDEPEPPGVSGRPPPGTAMTPVGEPPMEASLALTGVLWGTRLDLACTYEAGLDPSHVYALVVGTRAGGSERVATWRGLPGRSMALTAATSIGRDDIAWVEVRTRQGHRVLRLTG